jgi:hypothetical protein
MSFQGTDGKILARLGEGGALAAGIAVIPGTAANQVKLPTGANQMPLGITKYATAAAGDAVEVVVFGTVEAVVLGNSSNIAVGDPLTVNGTTGKLSKSAITNGLHIFAVALEAATADDVVITVLIDRSYLPTA